MSKTIASLKDEINEWEQVVIIPHTRPDGDAMGASLALQNYFQYKNIRCVTIAPTYYPEFLHWLPGHQNVWQFLQKQPQTTSVIQKADAVFCLDYNDLNRIDRMNQIVENHAKQIINIDHHLEPKHFGHVELIDSSASSTCELVYEFFKEIDALDAITPDIAACLYTGIFTDTGGFKHNNTSAKTHKIAADLFERGVDIDKVHDELLNSSTANRLQFIGHALANRLKFYPFLNAAMIYISKEDAEQFELESGDTEGLVNMPLGVKGVRFSTLIKEDEEYVKLSFRSKSNFTVNTFATEHFNGGGHAQAAGGRNDDTLENTIKKFEKLLNQYKEVLNQ